MAALEPWSDFITDFMSFNEDVVSPRLFKLWSAISMVGAILEKRVWVSTKRGLNYPNLYVLLVAPPGIGKFVIERAKSIMNRVMEPGSKTPAIHLASDSVSNASLMDELGKAKRMFITPDGPPLTYNSLYVVAEEFQVLLPGYDLQMIASLNSIWNNKDSYKESRRASIVKELVIENPQFNMLAGAQPSYFASTFPEEAWSTGFARRIIMVYSMETRQETLWGETPNHILQEVEIVKKLAKFSQLYGCMKWTPEAASVIDEWQLAGKAGAGGPPIPTHSKLAHYCRTRTQSALKLAMISAVSRTGRLIIEKIDVTRAIEWLVEVEAAMPDIFREMIGKSDAQVIEETYLFITSAHARSKSDGQGGRLPVSKGTIIQFLLSRVPHEKCDSIINAMEAGNIIARVAGTYDMYVPKPKLEHFGVE